LGGFLSTLRVRLVPPPHSQSNCQSVGMLASATPARVSCGEDCEERDFDCERFVDIAIQVIAQFFETPDALQDFGCAESACQCSGFFSRTRKTTLRHTVTGAQNVRPPGE